MGPNWTDPAWRTQPRTYSVQAEAAAWLPVPGTPALDRQARAALDPAGSTGHSVKAREPRGPWTRIWQDSRRTVLRDGPEALANALPWVDRDRKDEPFEEVLARVSNELGRAHSADPEWALAVERDLRSLDARLARLPAPPPGDAGHPPVGLPAEPLADTRPFRPRPVWPGAAATGATTGEAQLRPTALGTTTPVLDGPDAATTAHPWQTPPDLKPAESAEQVPGPRSRRR
jgi:hypothetical protein